VIVLDASVLIALFDARDAQHGRAVERLKGLARSTFACSPITLAEVLVGPVRAGRLEAAQQAVRALGLHEIALPDDAARRLATLRAETGLRLPDCCVLLAAEPTGERIVSFDDRLVSAATQRGLASPD
jgi:predicted nucleic acid-binding protein